MGNNISTIFEIVKGDVRRLNGRVGRGDWKRNLRDFNFACKRNFECKNRIVFFLASAVYI